MISVLGAEKLSLVEIDAFLAASESVRFVGCGRTEIYRWVEHLLCHHEYPLQRRRSKGFLRAYFERMAGPSPLVALSCASFQNHRLTHGQRVGAGHSTLTSRS